MNKTLYKVLNEDGTPRHGGHGKWHLPKGDVPGEWMPPIEGELVPCQNGYHLCLPKDLLKWIGPDIFEAECRGETVFCDDKVIVREARLLKRIETWNDQTAQLFACDCVERVLPVFERERPDDDRPRLVIETIRRFVRGEATADEQIAARDAAWGAAQAAARDAIRDKAGHAVGHAAAYATRAAAWDVTRTVIRDITLDAARAAAWDTAEDATWNAVKYVADATAWDVAKDAERQWQTERLLDYLFPEKESDDNE